ncbi:hypothetical protein [Rhodococcus sp. IEGM 1379]|uniref:hypothetical protein n=1 Tax=Rhodococcus sp. IEGM 1379 TaxID=3047086 RepID=UPI0024B85F28|nr:hypothetical protein [Rhodococcus sp. IEGM 1379]MDI9916965.1 hypothetical protein [Rhodococcus sp. IEGM 1379]
MTLSELIAPSRELVPHRAILDAAEHTLVIARGRPYGAEQAFHELLGVAIRHRVEVLTLARALIDVSAARPPDDLPADTAHTVALQEWGDLLDLPVQEQPSQEDGASDSIEPAVEFLLSSDTSGRVVNVSLAFTIGAIIGLFAHDWMVLFIATAACTIWASAAIVVKIVRLSRAHSWASSDTQTKPTTQGSNNSRRHAIAA